ncbi:(2Fe-2S)-binding protein [Mycolicibacterium smegmatis]|uniref:(2Fe-2S)-binding protein n=1 Tax=Mycolicibacterium smegmatis TaxID=1772 RepID=UPI001E479594|nr:(2Fe-2S)-binding protein [Mycolicibacterium smegmatis]MCP2624416.1 (2Fe-2S)-binding protein [Mycolicibacterium smegmatis]UGU32133.1 (2Fe-2S)-binding protein [Mycolicibacterium smegmatis]ULN37853.1 (2Fe-2S)-binding protein [Mycolicibacterium smegmatis]ULN73016.1 (2Fe-2S)-binding protein [Mycolicibacterium smegmatis]
MSDTVDISVEVDGDPAHLTVEADLTLLDVLREELGRTEVRAGCRNGDCGTCTAVVDGRCVKTCLILAARADGARVKTIATLSDGDRPDAVQRAFMEQYGFQCGFCLPGMLLAATDLLDRDPNPSAAAIRDALSGNLCRCTGYTNAVRTVQRAAELRNQPPS